MSYRVKNKVGSPRIHLLNKLIEAGVYSEFEKDGYINLVDHVGYFFTSELLEKNLDFLNCTKGVTSKEFMEKTFYSRPKINAYIENHGRIVYIHTGFYDLEKFKDFLKVNIKKWVERRGRRKIES